jgi:asparagine synthase (glutamine-hydrolysing)
MCGICGLATPEFAAIEPLVRGMMRSMVHRGPDDEGFQSVPLAAGDARLHLGLGFRRLSVLDLSYAGHQPMQHPNTGDIVVFNGEIYNFAALRSELQRLGDTFRSGTDTEVLLHALVHWGEGALERLDGMFAFAWYQASSRRLLLARDPAGIKPLYWTSTGGRFAFASELKSLTVLPWLDRTIDYRSLMSHISMLFAPSDATMFRAVRKLEPGFLLVLDHDGVPRVRRYAAIPFRGKPDIHERGPAASECLHLLRNAVHRQMVADVSVGGFLSGGIDSSAISFFAQEALTRATNYPVFTMRLGDLSQRTDGFAEDLPYASQFAGALGLQLHVVTASLNLAAQTDRMIWQLDEPISDPAAMNVWYLCEAARAAGVTVLLSGAGADDIFTGYRRHAAIKFAAYFDQLPTSLRKTVEYCSTRLTSGTAIGRRLSRLWRDADKLADDRLIGYFMWLNGESARDLLNEDAAAKVGNWSPADALKRTLTDLPPETHPLNRMLYLEQKHFLADHNLIYTDKMSMAHGVEVRVPFLSFDMVRFAERLSPRLKHRGIAGKSILRDALRGIIPQSILRRPKTGFGINLRRVVVPIVRDRLLSKKQSGLMQFLRRDTVANLLDAHESGRLDAAYSLYALVCLDSWIDQFKGHA